MKIQNRHYVTITFAVFVIVVLFISTSTEQFVELESGVIITMGTFARVVVIAEDIETARLCIENAISAINNVNNLMSIYIDNSEMSLVNANAADEAVQVSESTFEVIQRSIEFSKLTDGAFDITVGPSVSLFREAKETNIAPTQEQIEIAREKTGYEKLILDSDNRTIRFEIKGMYLDLGGIAKGYGIDKAIEAIQESGAVGGMVDIGGDIRCFGRPLKGRDSWRIGVQDPNLNNDTAETGLVMILGTTEGAIATSGDYQQFVIIEGTTYSHIINRETGTSNKELSSVTIIAENATDADALATGVSVMGAEKGITLIENLPNTEAILISLPPENEIIQTSGASKYIKSE